MIQIQSSRVRPALTILVVLLLVAACDLKRPSPAGMSSPIASPAVTVNAETTEDIQTPPMPSPTSTAAPEGPFALWYAAFLPAFAGGVPKLPQDVQFALNPADAQLLLIVSDQPGTGAWAAVADRIFALVAPFPTVEDQMEFDLIKGVWQGRVEPPDGFPTVFMTDTTMEAFSEAWGTPVSEFFKTESSTELLLTAWITTDAWALIPFEELEPRWKVIRVDGISPLDQDFSGDRYPLRMLIGLEAQGAVAPERLKAIAAALGLASTNRDPAQLTTLILTGTTALVRYTAQRMEEKGVLYPAEDIADLLQAANFTHISNEVSFFASCPPANPVRVEQRFCSDPSYLDLLEYIDADVIELTGNHILDWGEEPFLATLDLYDKNGMAYYGGGRDLKEARTPAVLEHNGERLWMIGCSPAGPAAVWAGSRKSGSNPCDWNWMQQQIDAAFADRALPVVTFQHLEVEDYVPHSSQRVDFQRAAQMGAIIISGSQSHFPQTMTFVGDHFVHYGLGNLFFDQMYGENMHGFIDRHVFYQGRYISTELWTVTIEDSAKPRLMTQEERAGFLSNIFSRCNWETAFPERSE